MKILARTSIGFIVVLGLAACASIVDSYGSESPDAMVLYWANKHEIKLVKVDLDTRTAELGNILSIPTRDKVQLLKVSGTPENKLKVRSLLNEGWDARDNYHFSNKVMEPGDYALVLVNYTIPGVRVEQHICQDDRAPVFHFEGGTISTLENWAHLKTRLHETGAGVNNKTQLNNKFVRLILDNYPGLAGEVRTAPIVALIDFEIGGAGGGYGYSSCYYSKNFRIVDRLIIKK